MPLNKIRATKQIRGDGNSIHYFGGDALFHDMPTTIIEDLSSQATGSTAHFVVTSELVQGSVRVYVNGIREPNSIISTYDADNMGFTLTDIVPSGSNVVVDYNDITYTEVNPTQFQTLVDEEPITWNLNYGNATVTLGGNRHLSNPLGMVAGQNYYLKVIQDGVGNRELAPDNAYLFPDGHMIPLTVYPSGVDLFQFISDGSKMYTLTYAKNLRSRIFGPTDFPNCVLWYDLSVLPYNENDRIVNVTDKSTAMNDGTSTDGFWTRLSYTNGLDAGVSNGPQHILLSQEIISTSGTYFAVTAQYTDYTNDYILTNDVDHMLTMNSSDQWLCGNGSTFQDVFNNNVVKVKAASFDGTTIRRYRNGSEVTPETNSAGLRVKYIGGDGASKGSLSYFYEFAIFDRTLSTQEIQDLTLYFRDKWGI